jgi:hypothetical protein
MTLYEYLTTNIARVKKDTALGIMPCSILRHWEIYSRYDAYKKMKYTVVDSVLNAADDMHVSERIVFKIIKKMETNVSADN